MVTVTGGSTQSQSGYQAALLKTNTPPNTNIHQTSSSHLLNSSPSSLSSSRSTSSARRHLVYSNTYPSTPLSSVHQLQSSNHRSHSSHSSLSPASPAQTPSSPLASSSSASASKPLYSQLFHPKPPLPIVALALSPSPNSLSSIASGTSQPTRSSQTVALAARGELKIIQLINYHSNSNSLHHRSPLATHTSAPPQANVSNRCQTTFSSSFASNSVSSLSSSTSSSSSLSITSASLSISERLSIKLNADLGAYYGIADLSWGYSGTSDHLTAACTNGAILVWDLNPNPSSQPPHQRRILTLDHAHSRAINKITFAGPTGQWIVSGAQDGFIKIWDIREGSTPKMVITTHSDPIRQLRFHPRRTSDPFIFLALTDSGTLSHFDIRKGSYRSCLTRRVAHTSPGLGLDWTCGPDHSLVATASSDGIVKIWNMSDGCLPATAIKTLVVGRSVRSVLWRPGHPTQLVIAPSSVMADPSFASPPLATAKDRAGSDRSSSSTLGSNSGLYLNQRVGSRSSQGSVEHIKDRELVDGGRHSETLIWDIRRERVPELVVKGQDGPASGVVWLSPNLLLTTHKRSGAIVQHDITQTQERFADQLPNQALAISGKGDVCFASGSCRVFTSDGSAVWNAEDELSAAVIRGMPAMELPPAFEFLAENYIFDGSSLEAVCEHNANVSKQVGLLKTWELWMAIQLWFSTRVSQEVIAHRKQRAETMAEDQLALSLAMRRLLDERPSDSPHGLSDFKPSSSIDRYRIRATSSQSPRRPGDGTSEVTHLSPLSEVLGKQLTSMAECSTPVSSRVASGTKTRHAPFTISHTRARSLSDTSDDNASSFRLLPPQSEPSYRTHARHHPHSLGATKHGGSKTLTGRISPGPSAIVARSSLLFSTVSDRRDSSSSQPTSALFLARRQSPAVGSSSSNDSDSDERSHTRSRDKTRVKVKPRPVLGMINTSSARLGGGVINPHAPRSSRTVTPQLGHMLEPESHSRRQERRRSMSKDRIAAKMHARGASSAELGSLLTALGPRQLVPVQEELNRLKRLDAQRETRIELNLRMRSGLMKMVRRLVEDDGDVQIGFLFLSILEGFEAYLEEEEGEEGEKGRLWEVRRYWTGSYLRLLKRFPRLRCVAEEIKKRFPTRESEEACLRISKGKKRSGSGIGNGGEVWGESTKLGGGGVKTGLNAINYCR